VRRRGGFGTHEEEMGSGNLKEEGDKRLLFLYVP